MLFWSLILFCIISISSGLSPSPSNGDAQYLLLFPKRLVLGVEYNITVEVSKTPYRLQLTFENIPQLKTIVKDYEVDYPVNIPVFIDTLNDEGIQSVDMLIEINSTTTENVSIIAREKVKIPLIRQNTLIFVETSKPIYKPGELIQFRILPIFMNDLRVSSTKNFTEIFLQNPSGSRLFQQVNIPWQKAMNLSYQLQQDTELGTWQLSAQFNGLTETHKFKVQKYVLPKFTIDVSSPKEVLITDKEFPVKVCATYGTGRPMKAEVKLKVCSGITKCIRVREFLSGNKDCQSIAVSTMLLNSRFSLYRPSNYNDHKVDIMAEIYEDGTQEKVEKTIDGPTFSLQRYKINIKAKDYFKKGLPFYFRVECLDLYGQPLTKAIPLYIIVNTFDGDAGWGFQQLITTDNQGNYEGNISTASASDNWSLLVKEALANVPVDFDTDEEEDKWAWKNVQPAEAIHGVNAWKSKNNTVLQLKPIQADDVTCNGKNGATISLVIQTNVNLLKHQLNARAMSRGKQFHLYTRFNLKKINTFDCQSRDDNLGHYQCTREKDQDRQYLIKCKKNYFGINCNQAKCNGDCQYGFCIAPNQCVCRPGWSGAQCDTCFVSKRCKNGYCTIYNKCFCRPGWTGKNCDLPFKTNQFQPNINSNENENKKSIKNATNQDDGTQKRAIVFNEYAIDIDLDMNMFPDTHVILYTVYNDTEIIAEDVEVPNLNECWESAMATADNDTTTTTSSTFQFSRNHVEPAANFSLTLNPPGGIEQCSLRISDITLNNFGNSGGVDFQRLINDLNSLNHKFTEDSWQGPQPYVSSVQRLCGSQTTRYYRRRYHSSNVADSSQAFSKAGFLVMSNLDYSYPECIVPFMSMIGGPPGSEVLMSPMMEDSMGPLRRKNGGGNRSGGVGIPSPIKARIREFFPETWKFENIVDKNVKQLNLTAPDSMTTWVANAYCVTQNQTLWVSRTQKLTVALPFYIEPSLPYSVKRGETMIVPIKIISFLDECFELRIQVSTTTDHLLISDSALLTTCICGSNVQKTIYQRVKAIKVGQGQIQVIAQSTSSSYCGGSKSGKKDFIAEDGVRRPVLVEYEGIPSENVTTSLLCSGQQAASHAFVIDKNMISGSLRVYLQYGSDLIGPALENLDKLVKLPYGCGEQNMVSMVPSIYVLDYITGSGLNETQRSLATRCQEFVTIGYQRQLQYQHDNGSFSAFGKSDAHGSTWLTAFVYKSFLDAKKHLPDVVADSVLQSSRQFLTSQQDSSDGCFVERGRLLSSSIKGSARNDASVEKLLLTAYIVSSLDESSNKQSIKSGLECMKKIINSQQAAGNYSVYTLALVSYTLALHDNQSDEARQFREKLWSSRVFDSERKVYFSDSSASTGSYASVETTAYAYLALRDSLSITDLLPVIRWLNAQRNSLGGYYSTQDTIVALKAISKFNEDLYKKSSTAASTDTKTQLTMQSGEEKLNDTLSREENLLTKKWRVPLKAETIAVGEVVNTEFSSSGSSCVMAQSIFLYNLLESSGNHTAHPLRVTERKMSKTCLSNSLLVCVSWAESILPNASISSDMIMLTVEKQSGWLLLHAKPWQNVESNRPRLQEIADNKYLNFYFDGFDEKISERCLELTFNQVIAVKDAKSSSIKATVYYQPEINIEINYNLDSCGQSDSSSLANETQTEIPPIVTSCPTFTHAIANTTSLENVQEALYGNMSKNSRLLLAFQSNQNDSNNNEWTVFMANDDEFFEWTSSLKIPDNCGLQVVENEKALVVMMTDWWGGGIQPGYPIKLDRPNTFLWRLSEVLSLVKLPDESFSIAQKNFARMIQRLRERNDLIINWNDADKLTFTPAELQCPIMASADFNPMAFSPIMQKSLCESDKNYNTFNGQLNVSAPHNTTNRTQEWSVTLNYAHVNTSGWNVTFVLPIIPGSVLDPIVEPAQTPCSWNSFLSVEPQGSKLLNFTMHVAKQVKMNRQRIFIDGDFLFTDSTTLDKFKQSLCKKEK